MTWTKKKDKPVWHERPCPYCKMPMGREFGISKEKHPWCHKAIIIDKIAREQLRTEHAVSLKDKSLVMGYRHFKNTKQLDSMVMTWQAKIMDGRDDQETLLRISKGESE